MKKPRFVCNIFNKWFLVWEKYYFKRLNFYFTMKIYFCVNKPFNVSADNIRIQIIHRPKQYHVTLCLQQKRWLNCCAFFIAWFLDYFMSEISVDSIRFTFKCNVANP